MEKLYVVEGTHDESILKQIDPKIKTISVGGSEIKKDVIEFLKAQQNRFDVVLFLDPDHAGERIRNTLSQKLNQVSHIFLDKKKSISKNGKKIGVEHASLEDLKVALNHEIKEQETKSDLTLIFFESVGLTGKKNSKTLRIELASHFHIGYVNAKTLLKRLSWLKINQKQIKELLDASST